MSKARYIIIGILVHFLVLPLASAPLLRIENIDLANHPQHDIRFSLQNDDVLLNVLDVGNIAVLENGKIIQSQMGLKIVPADPLDCLIIIDTPHTISERGYKKALGEIRALLCKIAIRQNPRWFLHYSKSSPREYRASLLAITKKQVNGTISVLDDAEGILPAISDVIKKNSLLQPGSIIIVLTSGAEGVEKSHLPDAVRLVTEKRIRLLWIHPSKKKPSSLFADFIKRVQGVSTSLAAWKKTVHGFANTKQVYDLTYNSEINALEDLKSIELRIRKGMMHVASLSPVHIHKTRADMSGYIKNNLSSIVVLIGVLVMCMLCIAVGYLYFDLKKVKNSTHVHDDRAAPNDRDTGKKSTHQTLLPHVATVRGGEEGDAAAAWLIIKQESITKGKHGIHVPEMIIGSDGSCDLVIEENAVKRQHAKIKNMGRQYILFDLLSESGTYLNGKKLIRPKELHDWDEIRIGSSTLLFRISGSANSIIEIQKQ